MIKKSVLAVALALGLVAPTMAQVTFSGEVSFGFDMVVDGDTEREGELELTADYVRPIAPELNFGATGTLSSDELLEPAEKDGFSFEGVVSLDHTLYGKLEAGTTGDVYGEVQYADELEDWYAGAGPDTDSLLGVQYTNTFAGLSTQLGYWENSAAGSEQTGITANAVYTVMEGVKAGAAFSVQDDVNNVLLGAEYSGLFPGLVVGFNAVKPGDEDLAFGGLATFTVVENFETYAAFSQTDNTDVKAGAEYTLELMPGFDNSTEASYTVNGADGVDNELFLKNTVSFWGGAEAYASLTNQGENTTKLGVSYTVEF